jgi:hypothetical protein
MAQLYLDEDVTAGVLHLPITYAYLCNIFATGGKPRVHVSTFVYIFCTCVLVLRHFA